MKGSNRRQNRQFVRRCLSLVRGLRIGIEGVKELETEGVAVNEKAKKQMDDVNNGVFSVSQI